ncbi:hypothetical protein Esti_004319 [Eimeria stiedai]
MQSTGSHAKLLSRSVAAAAAAAPFFSSPATQSASVAAATQAAAATTAATAAATARAAAAQPIRRIAAAGGSCVSASCRSSGSSRGFGVTALLQQKRLVLTSRTAEAATAATAAAVAAPAAAAPAAGGAAAAPAAAASSATAALQAALHPGASSHSISSSKGEFPCSSSSSSSTRSSSSDVDSSMVDGWFHAIDANRDGLISQREFRTWYCLHFVPTFALQQQQQQQLLLQQQEQSPQQQQQSPQQQQERVDYSLGAAAPAEAANSSTSNSSTDLSHERSNSSSTSGCIFTSQQHVQQRLLQLEKEAAALRAALQAGQEEQQQPLSSKLLLLIILRSSIPYMGFGFMDNWSAAAFAAIAAAAATAGGAVAAAAAEVSAAFAALVAVLLRKPQQQSSQYLQQQQQKQEKQQQKQERSMFPDAFVRRTDRFAAWRRLEPLDPRTSSWLLRCQPLAWATWSAAPPALSLGASLRDASTGSRLPKARLSPRQAESTEARNAHLFGSVVGICLGCIMGLFPLLVMPNRRREDAKEEEKEGDSSEEDSMPLGAKRFKHEKSVDAAAPAAPMAAAAAAASKESDALVKEEERRGGADGAPSAAATAAAESKPAAAAAGPPAVVSGSLAAALRSGKSEGPKEGPPKKQAGPPPSSQSPVGARRRTNKYIKTEENFEPICRWWERDLSQIENNVWQYLEHNGLVFAPPYEPHGIAVKYKGQEVSLPPAAEEVANFWCGILESDYATKIRFVRNFWRAFLSKLPPDHLIKADPKHAHVRIVETEAAAAAAAAAAAGEDPVAAAAKARAAAATAPDACGFEACDFSQIKQHLDALKEAKKNLSKEEKEALKAQKDAEAAPFAFALVDWLREKVGNSKVEPPGLFRGRGEHPKQGMLKRRIFPEDVILNLAEEAPVPRAADMPGHCWRDIAHDCRVTWLAFYRDSINDQVKYMYLAAQSGFKGQQDFLKYEKARRLKHYVKMIREDYFRKMRSTDAVDRQLGTATYLIDFLALRVGGEKDTDEEADTVGCCSLRVEHTTLNSETEEVTFDFLGKDSIRYFNTVKIDSQAFKNLVGFCKGKKPDEDVFDRINSASLNSHLKQLMPGLSAKMFRTYNASITLQQELQKLQPTLRLFKEELQQQQQGSTKVKMKQVAKAHADLVGAAAAAAASGAAAAATEEGRGAAEAAGAVRSDKGNEKGETEQGEEAPILDINLSDVNQLVQFYNDANRAVAILCNHQRSVPKQHAASMARLELQLQGIEEDMKELKAFQAHLKKHKGDSKGFKYHSDFVGPKGEPRKSVVRDNMREDAVAKKLELTEKRRQVHLLKMRMKDDNKTVALGTSKINYMDPRITVAFCKQFEVPIEKVFNKSLRLKFPWAMFAPSTFVF